MMNNKEPKPALSWPQAATSPQLRDRVANARVLAVGAGGIGCELLKTLAMTGFNHIEVIDLDTIETSNLNRQFLFRNCHVGQSKAAVAAEAVRAMRPGIEIVAHQGNVKDPAFGLDFFRRFDLVLGGLDNLEARRHVNRLCLAAGVPLVESGTAGYLGQVTVHVRGATQCFECSAKQAPKSYPVCTIRNTPEKPIHCVVWAKDLLFPRLLGGPGAVTDLDEGGEASGGGEEGGEEAAPAEKEDLSFYARKEEESSREYAERIFRRVFGSDIQRLVEVESLWRARKPPTPLDLDALLGAGANGQEAPAPGGDKRPPQGAGTSACRMLGLNDAHVVWDAAQCARVFLEAVRQFHDSRGEEVSAGVQFDKDDSLAVEAVAAAANLRATAFGIPPLSLFDAKGMAGNIIHAIATTNAIVSGLVTVEALKLLAGSTEALKYTYLHKLTSSSAAQPQLQKQPGGGAEAGGGGRRQPKAQAPPPPQRLLAPESAPAPAPACMVCGRAQVQLAIDTRRTTLQQLLDRVVRGRLSLVEPTLVCGDFMYEEGEGLDPDEVAANAGLLPRALHDLPGGGLVGGSIVELSDQRQHLTAQLVISHRDEFGEENPDGFILSGFIPKQEQQQQQQQQEGAPAAKAPGPAAVREDEDGALVLDESDEEEAQAPAAPPGRTKRKAGEGAVEEAQGGKRTKQAPAPTAPKEDEDGVIILDDD